MKAAFNAAPMALAMPSSRRWLEALTTWFRDSSRAMALPPAPLFDDCSTDVLARASMRRAEWLRDAR
jgi:hypothetical protein